jgi:hypothetical protein
MNERTAQFVQTLVFYDEPQLVLLRSDKNTDIVGIAIPRHDGMEYPFFACEARQRTFERYLDGKADLHYLFSDAIREKYFLFDLGEADDRITLYQADEQNVKTKEYWPLPGAFSRAHTSLYRTQVRIGTVTKKYSAGV